MILPVSLVDRAPMEKYQLNGESIESALKSANKDLLNIYNELTLLNELAEKVKPVPVNLSTASKTEKSLYKRETSKDSDYGRVISAIDSLTSEYIRMIKNNDYAAMVMASYPDSIYLDKSKYWDMFSKIHSPILIRGIANYRIGVHANKNNKDYYFIETGYLGNYPSDCNQSGRKNYHRIVKNSMQHLSVMDVPSDRWNSLVKFDPRLRYSGWKKKGSKILVVLSTDKPFKAYGEDREEWIKFVLDTLKQHTDREIVFREKSARSSRSNNTIYDALDNDIYAVVTYNSIAAVEAVQYGIPAFALAPTAADPVSSKDLSNIETPYMPNEDFVQQWLNSIAYSQFNLEEIITGRAWQLVLENEHRKTISY